MSPPLPVPSKAAIRALRGLALGTSCAIGLIMEDRRRRICTLKTALENKKKIRSSRLYHGAPEIVAPLTEDAVVLRGDEIQWWHCPSDVTPTLGNGKRVVRRSSANASAKRSYSSSSRPPPEEPPGDLDGPAQAAPREPPGPTDNPGPHGANAYPRRPLKLHPTPVEGARSKDGGGWARAFPPKRAEKDKPDPSVLVAQLLERLRKEPDSLDEIATDFLNGTVNRSVFMRLGDQWTKLSVALCRNFQARGRWLDAQNVLLAAAKSARLGCEAYYAHDPIPVIQSALPPDEMLADPNQRNDGLARLRIALKLFLVQFNDKPSIRSPELVPVGKALIPLVLAYNQPQHVREIYWRVLSQLDDSTEFTAETIKAIFNYGDFKSVLQLFKGNFTKTAPDEVCFREVVEMMVASVEGMRGAQTSPMLRALAIMAQDNKFEVQTGWVMKLMQVHWARHHDLTKTRFLFDQILSSGLLNQVVHPQYVYKVMIELLVLGGDVDAARNLRDELLTSSPKMANDVGLMGYFALAKAQDGDWDGVIDDFARMKVHKLNQQEAYDQAFVRVLKLFVEGHPVAEIEELIKYFISEMHVTLHPYMVTLVANSYGHFHEAGGLVAWLKYCSSAGFALTPAFTNGVLRNCRLKWNYPFWRLRELFTEIQQLQDSCVDDVTEKIMHGSALRSTKRTGYAARRRVLSLRLSLSRKPYFGRSASQRDVLAHMHEALKCSRPSKAMYVYRRALRYGMAWSPACFRVAVLATLQESTEKASNLITSTFQQGYDVTAAVQLYLKAELNQFRGTFEDIMTKLKALVTRFETAGILMDSSVLTHAAIISAQSGHDAKAISLCTVAMQKAGTSNPCFSRQCLRALLMAYHHTFDAGGLRRVVDALPSSPLSEDTKALTLLKSTRRHLRRWNDTERVLTMRGILDEGIASMTQRRAVQRGEANIIHDETLRIMSDAVMDLQRREEEEVIPHTAPMVAVEAMPAQVAAEA